MKALTLTEPWATLMALHEKTIETRSWRMPNNIIGQEVAIHSAKGYPKWAQETCLEEPFKSSLAGQAYSLPAINRGHVLCIVKFTGSRLTEDMREQITDKERAFGDYADGRWAWFSEFIRRLDYPTPAVGHLGFWEWDARESKG